MTDSYYDPASYGGAPGVLMPQIAAAQARDPRSALVQALMRQSSQVSQIPHYSAFSPLADLLSGAATGYAGNALNQQYAGLNRSTADAMSAAMGAGGPTGIAGAPPAAPASAPASPNAASGAPPVQLASSSGALPPGSSAAPPAAPNAQPGGGDPFATMEAQGRALAAQGRATNNPLLVQQGYDLFTKAQIGRAGLAAKLGEQRLAYDPGTNTVRLMGGAADATRQEEEARSGGTETGKLTADVTMQPQVTAGKVAEANALRPGVLATEQGKANIEQNKAIGIARGTAPIDIFKEQFKPVVDRTTGEVTIPGLDPKLTAQIAQAMGVDLNALKGSLGGKGAPNAAPAAPGGQGTQAPAPGTQTTAAPPQTQPTGSATPSAPVPFGTKTPAEEVPKVDLPTGLLPAGPGTIIQGRDPVAIKAGEGAVEQANEQFHETQKAAAAAGQVHAQIGTMLTEVQNGGITPSATANGRYFLASAINAIAGKEAAKQITGVDPESADVVSSVAGRMGLTYARQTEGAREAVAGIQIALKANPQLTQSKEGFITLLKLMDAGTQHDLAAQQYGDAWFGKNNHYVGSQAWFNQNHPPAEFTSKVLPYNLPALQDGTVDSTKLQPNVTYNLEPFGEKGLGIWTGQGFKRVKQ